MSKITDVIQEAIAPTVTAMGARLVDVEITKENGNKVLMVYIQTKTGVTLDDCEAVSKAIDPVLDELDPIEDAYYLCVSSPGIDRPLKRDEDFRDAIGKRVEIKLYRAAEGQKTFEGVLTAFDEEKKCLSVCCEGDINRIFTLSEVAVVKPVVTFEALVEGDESNAQ